MNSFKLASVGGLLALLTACSNQTNAARIQDLSDSPSVVSSNNQTRTTVSDYSEPPKNISSTQPISRNSVNESSTYQSNYQSNNVTTTQERIVYNRNYDEIPKGGYKGDTYTVKHGDTLFYIAWITGNDFRSLAAKNNIKAPYDLTVGQTLNVGGTTSVVVTKTTSNNNNTTKPTTVTTTTTTTSNTNKKPATNTVVTTPTTTVVTNPTSSVANIKWQWPAKGKVIEKFSNATKGIDIAGALGDNVVAAADGKVVYAGNALAGYGNLIIIKHNDDYLTAYAHNQNILVKEQQDVKAGQQIATMGNTGASSIRLHFEIRYKAKSVDPLQYLPK